MSLDSKLISTILKKPELLHDLQRSGIDASYFNDQYRKLWTYLVRMHDEHGEVPSPELVESRFKFFDLEKTKKKDVAILTSELHKRHKFTMFLEAIDLASLEADDVDTLDTAIANLQGSLNDLTYVGSSQGLIDAFANDARQRMIADFEERRRGGTIGIPTGLKRLDYTTGGLQHSRMVVIMARPGVGKSWLNLLFVASAVMAGKKVVLFPLEMSFEDTIIRLYTIFSQRMYGSKKVLRNMDLTHGRISPKKVDKFLGELETRFAGQLFIADIGNMNDPYTVERIGAEVSIYQPDMFWIDYLTLMKAPGIGRDGGEDHTTVKALSNGVQRIAVRHRCVGGVSAQVNREAVRTRDLLPRVENIAYGDSIGQDASLVVSINRKGAYLYYALVKHRGGPEIGKTRVQFMVDEGILSETEDQDDDDDE